jgi:hypothetical protein
MKTNSLLFSFLLTLDYKKADQFLVFEQLLNIGPLDLLQDFLEGQRSTRIQMQFFKLLLVDGVIGCLENSRTS